MIILDDVIKLTQQHDDLLKEQKVIHRNITDNTIYCTLPLSGYVCYITYINETIGFAFFAVPNQGDVVLIYSRVPISGNYSISLPQGDKRLFLGHQNDEIQEKLAIIWNLWSKLCSHS